MKDSLILRITRWDNEDKKVILARELNVKELDELKEYITDVYENEGGGITIIVEIEL